MLTRALRRLAMIRKRTRPAIAVAAASAAVVSVASALVPAGPAQAAEPTSRPFCATLLSPAKGPGGTSAVLARRCATTSRAAAAALPGVAASTRLMTWYTNAGWTGNPEDIYGSDGTCDASGYRFRTDLYWQNRLSSVRGYGNCNYIRVESPNGRTVSAPRPPTTT
jgi:hypothetical protein